MTPFEQFWALVYATATTGALAVLFVLAVLNQPNIPVVTFIPANSPAVERIVQEALDEGRLPDCDDLPRPVVGVSAVPIVCELER